ncbi:phage head closure protein [Clostridium culturomicium]|uniref:phage head closure protein n=1 Tax=Clostridium culturomicium TaxID=1499683 RepID=UPI0038578D0F
MQFINAIYLIVESYEIDEVGDKIHTEDNRKVLAHISSVKQSEFYQAHASGFKPEIAFVLRSFEYKGEDSLRYNDKKYKVIRSYNKGDGNVELICTGAVNNVSAT